MPLTPLINRINEIQFSRAFSQGEKLLSNSLPSETHILEMCHNIILYIICHSSSKCLSVCEIQIVSRIILYHDPREQCTADPCSFYHKVNKVLICDTHLSDFTIPKICVLYHVGPENSFIHWIPYLSLCVHIPWGSYQVCLFTRQLFYWIVLQQALLEVWYLSGKQGNRIPP